MRAPILPSVADMLLMRCGYPPEPTGRRRRRVVVMDGVLYPSIRAAAGFAGVKEGSFRAALSQGRTRAHGHAIAYAEEER